MENKKPAGYLSEKDGTRSSTRLKSFLALIYAFIFLTIVLIKDIDLGVMEISIVLLLLVAAFVPQHLKNIADLKLGFLPGKRPEKSN